MGIRAVVSDFDNTITHEDGFDRFMDVYAERFCCLTGIASEEYTTAIAHVRRDMVADPLTYGWYDNGLFSAPVTGDPIGSNTVAHIELMKRMRQGKVNALHIPHNEEAVVEIREDCYGCAYPQKRVVFRDGAAHYVTTVARMFPGKFAIMSNSPDTSLRKKIATFDVDVTILGLVQKMVVGSETGQIQPPGFPVPVHPDRPVYLEKVREFHPSMDTIAVVGDHFFFDVAPILLHGGYGILLKTDVTQGYETPFLQAHPRGCFAHNYDDVITFLKKHI